MRLFQAFRVFFRVLSDGDFAKRVAQAESSTGTGRPAPAAPAASPAPAATPVKPASRRSDALTLLAVFQREGRLVDFLQEPIESYTDAQIGAAVREVHKGCRQVLERMFAPAPAVPTAEGAPLKVEQGYDPGRIRLTGQVSGTAPWQGTVAHPGWEAKRCDLPEWTGTPAAERVIAPAEIEIR